MTKNAILVVDLDDTLTVPGLNNTYHFLLFHYMRKMGKAGKIVYKASSLLIGIVSLLLRRIKIQVSEDTILITMLCQGQNLSDLLASSVYWFRFIVRKKFYNVKTLGLLKHLAQKYNIMKVVALACCIEVPACVVAKLINADKCIARRLRINAGSRIVRLIDKHNCVVYKMYQILRLKREFTNATFIYVVDKNSAEHEAMILKLFDNVMVV